MFPFPQDNTILVTRQKRLSKAPQSNASQDLIALISSHELIKCLSSMLVWKSRLRNEIV